MATNKPQALGSEPKGATPDPGGVPRELVVITKVDAGIQVSGDSVASTTGTDVTGLQKVLTEAGARLTPLFGVSEDRLRAEAATVAQITGQTVPDLSVYYRVKALDDRLEDLANKLRGLGVVDAAYIKPAAELPFLNDMLPSSAATPTTTPDFTDRQGYLDPAPGGVDARYAWTVPGGEGEGVSVIDVEGAWRFTHEDLLENQGGTIGTPSGDLGWRNHGTAVVGVLGGDDNGTGVTGISPNAHTSGFSIFDEVGSAAAIRQAANRLNPGDIILIELHRPGPRFGFQSRPDQRGYIAMEWWPDDLDAIRYAVARGVIVVGAAGNGAENLDDPLYETPGPGFPATWRNPFNPRNPGSGAVLVGAGAPPPGTHGANHGPDRSRLAFSNYGAALSAQGWGREVTTCGYGDLQGGGNEDLWYTDRFSGTSSSSPVVVGALACVQGVLIARGSPRLTPATARAILLETGSPQQDAPGRPSSQRIGNRPNVRQMIDMLP